MKAIALALVLVGQLAQSRVGRIETLRVPTDRRADAVIWLEVTLGGLQQGRELEIATPGGRLLGVISPFAKQAHREGGAYIVPIPADAVVNDRLVLRFVVTRGDVRRTPMSGEIKKIALVNPPAK